MFDCGGAIFNVMVLYPIIRDEVLVGGLLSHGGPGGAERDVGGEGSKDEQGKEGGFHQINISVF